ncbi:MAG: M20/M25/M40 family metallo-hydrolase [Flavobacteriaceae bacterium]|nr:M20/M25/M40 family metallo-hydrolase [Flavobacteriaceae bacterium]
MHQFSIKIGFAILLLISTSSIAQQISKTEQKIIDLVSKNHEEAIQLLEKTVNINSGTMNQDGVKKVADVFKESFQQIGFTTRWIEQASEVNRAGHFFAETTPKKVIGKKILLIGHFDTVFEENSPFQTYIRKDSIAYGPGINDMKGGNVLILYALKALKQAGVLNNAQIIAAFTGDEEDTGNPISMSRKDLIDAAKRSNVALGFETATGFQYATVARRSSSSWELEVTGKRAHSSGIFSENTGAGAIFETARILNSFYQELPETFVTFNASVILGGSTVQYDAENNSGFSEGKSNIVPEKTFVHGDLRCISREQIQQIETKMREIVSKNLPQTSATISFKHHFPPMKPTDGNYQLLKVLNQVSLDLNQGEVKVHDPGKRGAGDISFVADYVDGLDGLGALGSGAHSFNENINLNQLKLQTQRIALLIYRLIQTQL